MRVRTDDEVYRVDAVWLGPPKATFPWRARYVSWGIGGALFLLILGAERQIGIGFGFFSTAWAVVLTVLLTKVIGSRINHERPLRAVATMWLRELNTPRERTRATGGAASAAAVKVRKDRPRPPGAVPRVVPAPSGVPQRAQDGRAVPTRVPRRVRARQRPADQQSARRRAPA